VVHAYRRRPRQTPAGERLGRIITPKPNPKVARALLLASRQLLGDGENRDEIIAELLFLAQGLLKQESAAPLEIALEVPEIPGMNQVTLLERVNHITSLQPSQKVRQALVGVLRQLLADGLGPDELITPMLHIARGQLRVSGAWVSIGLGVPEN
jgi:hypothetical protein